MKSGNLKFLEPSGPLQACDGTALPLLFYSLHVCCVNGEVECLLQLRIATQFLTLVQRAVLPTFP